MVRNLKRASYAPKHERRLDQPGALCPGLEGWDSSGQSHPTFPDPSSPHTAFTQTRAPATQADFPGALACHSSAWQQEGSCRKWFITASFIKSAVGSPRIVGCGEGGLSLL